MAVHQTLPLLAEMGLAYETIIQPEQLDYYYGYTGVG